ncbi:MAG: PTS mannitol transporter subunit IICBA [Propionibacteriaceae bacterium]|nr:PTS mannitol transporter subunit IICBA [Propionibacteriaceae bacterium]
MTTLPDASLGKNLQGTGARAWIQRFGGYLASMIMPNIGAFIAWGLITALFIEKGWLPNATLAQLVGPMLYFLLPILIGYTGGRMVHGQRGAVIGAIATAGVIIGGITDWATLAGTPMFLGAMIMGPLAAYVLKLFDGLIEGKVASGFEMLVDNFSLGIIGMGFAILGVLSVGPVVSAVIAVMAGGVNALVTAGLLPLVSMLVEPAKVLFLNNAINHGIFSPLAVLDVQDAGKSILFMVESNPGAGLGLLLAFAFFGPRSLRPSTPGAIIIHFLGGIHEIYFPYVLMRPVLILAMIAGSMSGLFVGTALGAGLVATPAPGSIFAYFAVTPRGAHLAMILSVLAATVVSFLVAAAFLRLGRRSEESAEPAAPGGTPVQTAIAGVIHKVVIACDAGMGSSVMVASQMKKRLAPYGVTVAHTPVDQIPADAQVVLTHEGLYQRARQAAPSANVLPFNNYVSDPAFDGLEALVKANHESEPRRVAPTPETAAAEPTSGEVAGARLSADGVRLGAKAAGKTEAIRQAGELLVGLGAATPAYVEGMLAREEQISTYLGNGVAIPHGTNESRAHITGTALGVLQFPDGVDWGGETCYVAIPIASTGDEHVGILAALAQVLVDPEKADRLRTTTDVHEVLNLLAPEKEQS